MKFRALIPYALGSFLAIALTACSDSPTSPAVTSAEARADLQVVAAKVKFLSTPDPGESAGGFGDRGAEKKGAGKRGAAFCAQEAIAIDHYTDVNDYGVEGESWDTTTSYTASGALVCADEDVVAFDTARSYDKDSIAESWFTSRTDYPPYDQILTGGFFTINATGKVHYFSGYSMDVESLKVKFSFMGELKEFTVALALEKGYTTLLTPAPGMNVLSEEPLPPTTVVMTGPIKKDGATVGYFEVLANDGVVIKDASGVVIEAH